MANDRAPVTISAMNFKTLYYLENGELDRTDSVDTTALDETLVEHFAGDLKYLSGDLELPMERPLPGSVKHCEYRIASDLKGGAFVMVYFHDELVMASLMLQGVNELPETDLLQVFKYLLLEPEDIDEVDGPTDEQIDEILTQEAFDFEGESERPVLFNVIYELEPEIPEEQQHIENAFLHIAAAFFASPAEVVDEDE